MPDLRSIASDEKSRIGVRRSIWDLEICRMPDLRRIASDEKSRIDLLSPIVLFFRSVADR